MTVDHQDRARIRGSEDKVAIVGNSYIDALDDRIARLDSYVSSNMRAVCPPLIDNRFEVDVLIVTSFEVGDQLVQ